MPNGVLAVKIARLPAMLQLPKGCVHALMAMSWTDVMTGHARR